MTGTRAPSLTQSATAWLAALGLLLQVVLVAPLAARMTPTWPICSAGIAPSSDRDPSPGKPHRHDACPVCRSAAVGAAVLPSGAVLPLPLVAMLPDRPTWHRSTGASSAGPAYRSRAPPPQV